MFDLIPFVTKPHDLFDTFDRRLWNDMNAALGDFRTDITEESDKYVLEAELPGFKREDISVDVDDDRLVITAKTTSEKNEGGDKKNYVHRERRSATYQRSFSISNIATDAITASYNDGVLTLNLPKVQPKEAAARKIEIQ
ncbi:MAG: Hsp20/alpha crystallin family protein [Clostridiaceae bacterium]|nr:Hsp20/alpha crystallin family protein [Clostridiaceae bacterium]